jgi:omega-6 fatty acid desaturase (delta-12 desaturase)
LPLIGVIAVDIYTVSAGWPYIITLVLLIPGAFFLARIFIFFHDCTHGSFFKSKKLNKAWGTFFGILTFTPYDDWRRSHGIHHNTHGNLDRRGIGDIWTLTVREYEAQPHWVQFCYRIYRHPVFLFVLVPAILFFILQRFPHKKTGLREISSVFINNAGIAVLLIGLSLAFGWQAAVLVYIPMFYISAIVGLWLFYVQHQFDPGYWERDSDWDRVEASIGGSSHYKLPVVLQWLTGNIGLHHIHHVRPRIPNYNLQACYDATPELQLSDPLTLGKSFKSLRMNLWDEVEKRLLSFKQARDLLKVRATNAISSRRSNKTLKKAGFDS